MTMYIYHFVEVLALLLSIFYYSFLKAGCLKWLPAFLGFSCLADAIALAQGDKLHIDNIDIHYAAGVIQLLFYGNIFYALGKRESLQKLILVLVCIGLMAYVFTYWVYFHQYVYFFMACIISGFFLVAISLAYLYIQFEEDEAVNLLTDSGFWIALGVSLYYSGVSIVFSLYEVIRQRDLRLFGERLYNTIPGALSIVLYSSIIITIILCRKKNILQPQ